MDMSFGVDPNDNNLISVRFLRQQSKSSIPRGDSESGAEDWLPVAREVVMLKESVLVVV